MKTIKNSGKTKDFPAILDSFIFSFITSIPYIGVGGRERGGEGGGQNNKTKEAMKPSKMYKRNENKDSRHIKNTS